ncbi:MAG: HAD family hydrolase [Curvibacter sp.]|jgi:HAD superfamily hydrolase (TIGR01484 family)|nr:HAD-IIB family hydrolase [Curvibacter sp.]
MLPLSDWPAEQRRRITGVFTDIDDTLTTCGTIAPEALQALADLKAAGLAVVPITGRHIGWCLPLMDGVHATPWPADAMVAENGALALVPGPGTGRQDTAEFSGKHHRPITRLYQQDAARRAMLQARMEEVAARVLAEVPGALRARDAGGRETDLAFDYNEHTRLRPEAVQQILAILQAAGMYTTVSSIHVHGCFDDFNKWRGACWIVRELHGRDLTQELESWVFVGDSGNDQPMFQHFTHSVGVANIRHFEAQLTRTPRYITPSERGAGFAEVARALLDFR